MKKVFQWGIVISLFSMLVLSGCSKKDDQSAKSTSSDKKTETKVQSSESSTIATSSSSSATSADASSSAVTSSSTEASSPASSVSSSSSATAQSSSSSNSAKNASALVNYSDSQIEYARVTEALVHYYNFGQQPVEVSVTKNAVGHQVIPYKGSLTLDSASTTLSFSTDKSMATTVIVTYISNGNGSIYFYKEPNHYQDSRYQSDATWVKQQSQSMLNSMLLLSIPTQYDDDAAKIIDLIKVN